jgi:hypothetical protein
MEPPFLRARHSSREQLARRKALLYTLLGYEPEKSKARYHCNTHCEALPYGAGMEVIDEQ